MKKIFKTALFAIILLAGTSSFAKNDLNSFNFKTGQPLGSSIQAPFTGYLIRHYLHFAGTEIRSGNVYYNYNMIISITQNDSSVALTVPGTFTYTLNLTNASGQAPNGFTFTIPGGQPISGTINITADHVLDYSDVTGWTQSVYSYNGYTITPDNSYTPY